MKKILLMFFGLGALALVYLYMEGLVGKERIEPGKVSPVPREMINGTPYKVDLRTLPRTESIVGTVLSKQRTSVSAKAAAHVKTINVSPGELVAKGDLLATLDDRELKAKLQQVRSQKTAAEAQLSQAQAHFQRQENLRKKGATTDAAYEQAETSLRQAQAQVKTLEETLREIAIMDDFTDVTAPYGGVIVEKLVEVGTLVTPGSPLFILQDPGRLRLEVSVPARLEQEVTFGGQYLITIDALENSVMGTVEEILPSADPRTRGFTVRLALPDETKVRPGQFGRLTIPTGQEEMLLVPDQAITHVGQLDMVYVRDGDRIVARMVRVGQRYDLDGSMTRVLAGVDPGETVLLPAERSDS